MCKSCKDGFYLMGIERDNSGRCLACDPLCKTCSLSPTHCLSCLNDTFELTVGNRCLGKDRINIIVKLDIALEFYAASATNIRLGLAALLGTAY